MTYTESNGQIVWYLGTTQHEEKYLARELRLLGQRD